MGKFLDQMLRPKVEGVQKNLPTARYKVERLSGYRQYTIREIKNGSGRGATRS